ncbi:MAG: S8 family serine peptidase, partial [Thermonemataceae bacterium]|nr:S8 family serine peptidase [Thermonemataceae bacterium]
MPIKKNLLVILAFLMIFRAVGQDRSLMLQSKQAITQFSIEDFINKSSSAFRYAKSNGGTYLIVQFEQIPTEAEKQKISQVGLTLLSYLPHNAFWAYVPDNVSEIDLKTLKIKALYDYLPEHKIAETFQQKPLWAINETGKIDVWVQIFQNVAWEDIKTSLIGRNWLVILEEKPQYKMLKMRVNQDKLVDLAKNPLVFFVEPIEPKPILENREGRSNHRINFVNSEYAGGRKYDGTGVVVSMGDDGTAHTHIDKKGRINLNLTTNGGAHGDHVSGIIMGAGNLDPLKKGQAPGATLEVYDYYDDLDQMPAPYNDKGVRITSHSLGESLNAGYTSGAVTMDQQIRLYPELMHVFSSGNSGSGFYTITGGRKAAKNVVAVGNLTKTDEIASSSSRGPAADGRLKPEICAVGTNVLSTGENNTYYSATGTSMACPAISGVFATMYHAYKSLNGGTTPQSALIKALLMNTADDLGNVGPDYTYGYGRVNARRAVLVLEQNKYFQSSISQGNSNTHTINVPSGTAQLKVMLYWNDYEGASAASVPLVNNLDLSVLAPSTAVFQPWVLNPSNTSALATRGTDNINNSEQVTIDNPAAGSYTLQIAGTSVPQGPQNYVIVYEFIQDEVTVTFPIGGEAFHPSETETIRWDALGNSGTFTLEYSTNNGSTWTTISNSIAGNIRYYSWNVPNVSTSEALVRVSRSGKTGQSIANFSIAAPPSNLSFSADCNGIQLSWSAVAGASSYEIYRLGDKYMDLIGTSNTTSYTDNTVSAGEQWYAVRAIFPNGAGSRRTLAAKYMYDADLSVSNISPKNNVCVLTNTQEVKITISNNADFAMTNTVIDYSVKKADNTVVTSGNTTIPSIPANSSQILSITADMSLQNETYQIVASLTNPCDKDASNNQMTVNTKDIGVEISITQEGEKLVATSGYKNYKWYFDGVFFINTGTNNELLASKLGTYKVEAQSLTSSCKNTSADFVMSVLALEDVSNKLAIFPNPT